jgi:hypothetical protein
VHFEFSTEWRAAVQVRSGLHEYPGDLAALTTAVTGCKYDRSVYHNVLQLQPIVHVMLTRQLSLSSANRWHNDCALSLGSANNCALSLQHQPCVCIECGRLAQQHVNLSHGHGSGVAERHSRLLICQCSYCMVPLLAHGTQTLVMASPLCYCTLQHIYAGCKWMQVEPNSVGHDVRGPTVNGGTTCCCSAGGCW